MRKKDQEFGTLAIQAERRWKGRGRESRVGQGGRKTDWEVLALLSI